MDPLLIAETGLVALVFAAVFLFGGHLHLLKMFTRDHRSLVSFGAGMSAAYVFVHLMPEMHEARAAFVESVTLPLPNEGRALYLLSLVGFLAFYGWDRLRTEARSATDEGLPGAGFRNHIVGFAVYVALMSYMLLRGLQKPEQSIPLYAVAFAAHFLALEHSLREEHGELWVRYGRWILATACVFGWCVGLLLPLPLHVLALLTAFVSGAVIVTSMVMELPSEKDGRLLPFLAGGLLFALLLLPLG